MPAIEVNDLNITFRPDGKSGSEVIALSELDLTVEHEEFVALLGPSGCGKSTLLNCIAGFLKATAGEVLVDDIPVEEPGPDRGVVFQDANIFPWLTVEKNVAFGLQLGKRFTGVEINEMVADGIHKVGLEHATKNLPVELSGGMRQRVGIARVLVNDPPVLLMDEPFGALDAQTRIVMQRLLLDIWERDRKTVIFVTHDIDEALLLADRIVVMTGKPGKIQSQHKVSFPRPRTYDISTSREFVNLKMHLFDELQGDSTRKKRAA